MDYKDKQLNELSLPAETAPVEPSAEMMSSGEVDKEGAMAKADLVKLSTYSYKLFKQLEDDTQLESWVQAKITKAADYIATVYHHIAFEMKLNDYGHKLENSDMLSESQREVLTTMLAEGRKYVAELKKAQAAKMMSDSCGGKNIEFEDAGKTQPGFRGKLQPVEINEGDLPPFPPRESKKQQTIKPRTNKSEMPKTAVTKTAVSLKKPLTPKDAKLDEAKPSAGLTKKQKSTVVKKAKAGKDIGKKGKGFEKVAKKAAKTYGSKEKGEKVAAASMWKNIKRTVKEDIFNAQSPYANEPTMAALLKFRKEFEGSEWVDQLDWRINDLEQRFKSGKGAPQDSKGHPIKVLPPKEWADANPDQMAIVNSSIGNSVISAAKGAYDTAQSIGKGIDTAATTAKNAYKQTTKAVGDTIKNVSNAYDATTKAGKAAVNTFNKEREKVKESAELSAIKKLSGLNEWDQSDFRSGDESNPHSPYYNDDETQYFGQGENEVELELPAPYDIHSIGAKRGDSFLTTVYVDSHGDDFTIHAIAYGNEDDEVIDLEKAGSKWVNMVHDMLIDKVEQPAPRDEQDYYDESIALYESTNLDAIKKLSGLL
jgi:hypothetical protein